MKPNRLLYLVLLLVFFLVVYWINPLGPTDEELSLLLLQAAEAGETKQVRSLIAKGADVNATGEFGLTALHEATMGGNKDVVKLLIEKGANVNVKDKDGRTPLYEAVFYNCKENVELLITNGADIDNKNSIVETPMHIAIRRGFKEIVELLISHGADVNIKSCGQIPLEAAREHGRLEIADLLKAAGATESD